MLTIALNKFNINDYKAGDKIDSFIELSDTSQETFMIDIEKKLLAHHKQDIHNQVDTKTFFRDENYIYQMCYLDKPYDNNPNNLAIFMAPNNLIISSIACLFKFSNTLQFIPMTLDDIYYLIEHKIYHRGIIIKTNGLVKEFCYANEKFANINYPYKELSVIIRDYYYVEDLEKKVAVDDIVMDDRISFECYFNSELSNTLSPVSKLYGKNIYGDVIVLAKITGEQNSYIDLCQNDWVQRLSG